jgi:uncharacterized protein (TIGR02246 family)
MTTSTDIRARQVMDVERRFWNAMKDKDADTARDLTDDSCIIVGAQGVAAIDRNAMARMTTEATWELHQFSFDEKTSQVRFLSDDVAIVAYAVDERVTVDGTTLPVLANDSSVWVRRDGAWRCALHTESLRGDPFGRDKAPRAGT